MYLLFYRHFLVVINLTRRSRMLKGKWKRLGCKFLNYNVQINSLYRIKVITVLSGGETEKEMKRFKLMLH